MAKKLKRSDRENAALAKSEKDLARAKQVFWPSLILSNNKLTWPSQEYKAADDHLIQTLPPVISASFSLLPHLLATQIIIQNTLLGQCYTVLHNYCQDVNFPSPPPPMDEVISSWKAGFKLIQYEVETGVTAIAIGKTARKPMDTDDPAKGAHSGRPLLNGITPRRSSQPALTQKTIGAPPPGGMHSRDVSTALVVAKPRVDSVSPARSRMPSISSSVDGRRPSNSEISYTTTTTEASSVITRPDQLVRSYTTPSALMLSAVAAKKKPPPPPPKRGLNVGLWVTALYSFEGQGAGDLVFKEGDRIKVIKRTESTDDWWEGELQGTKGSFPANYCQIC